MSDLESYTSMCREARRWAECFSWDATAEMLLRMLRECTLIVSDAPDLEVRPDAGVAAVE
jgi:hypothetical protein